MFKALVSFSGKISMVKNEVRDIADKEMIKDLKRAGYIIEVKDKDPTKKATKDNIL